MAKIDFTKVPVKNVKGQTEEKNYRDYIAEQLYNQSHEEEGVLLAQKIILPCSVMAGITRLET